VLQTGRVVIIAPLERAEASAQITECVQYTNIRSRVLARSETYTSTLALAHANTSTSYTQLRTGVSVHDFLHCVRATLHCVHATFHCVHATLHCVHATLHCVHAILHCAHATSTVRMPLTQCVHATSTVCSCHCHSVDTHAILINKFSAHIQATSAIRHSFPHAPISPAYGAQPNTGRSSE